MLHVVSEVESKGAMAINSDCIHVTKQFLNRIKYEIGDPQYVVAFSVSHGGGGDTVESQVRDVEESILKALGPTVPTEDWTSTSVEDMIRSRLQPPYKAICAIPHQLANPDVVQTLRARFPRIAFLVETGKDPAKLDRLKMLNVAPLQLLSIKEIEKLNDIFQRISNIRRFHEDN